MKSRSVSEHQTILRILWLAAVGLVIVGSLLPDSSPPMQALSALHVNDKLEHLAAYAALAFWPTLHERRRVVAAIALSMIGMGVMLEFGQKLVAGRYFEIADMVANAFGVLVGIVLGLLPRIWIRPIGRVASSER
jgi:VanZ family protein